MSTVNARALDIRPITTTIGAEITGVDISQPLAPEVILEIREAWLKHQVVFFPRQSIGPDDQIRFASYFGEITMPSAVLPPIDDEHTEIVAFDSNNGKQDYGHLGKFASWHVDTTFQQNPPAGAVFKVVKLPSVGGATLFASAQAAYDSLSEVMKGWLDPLVAVHQFRFDASLAPQGGGPIGSMEWEGERVTNGEREHPVVAVHPDTGRKGLFVNPGFTTYIKGLQADESRVLLDFLYEHTLRPENVLRYHWSEGSVGFWDNRSVWHRGANDFDKSEHRLVHKVQLRGAAPVGPTAKNV